MADPWQDADHDVPLLLLPLRLETQSVPPADPEDPSEPVLLRVRFYPDDLAIDRRAGRPLLLPDRLEVVARVGDQRFSATGRPVTLARLLGVGTEGEPGSEARLATLAESLDDLTAGQGAATWLTDYRAAQDVGMAVTVELPPGTDRVDSVVVLGLRAGRSPDEESDGLAAALRAQGKDAGFLAPGLPTNNTEGGRSAWSRPGPGDPDGSAAPAAGPGSAADRLARALGVPVDGFATWPLATHSGELWAWRMAVALWPVTWGQWLTRALRPEAMDARTREQLRVHATSEVRGRGPLPLVRVGNQPYGVLPVTDLASYAGDDPVQAGLARTLSGLRPLWWEGVAAVPSVTRTGVAALPEILGQSPVSWGLRARRLLGTGGMLAGLVHGGSYEHAQARGGLGHVLEALLGTRRPVFGPPDLMGIDRTVGLPLVAEDDPDVLAHLAEGEAPAGHSVLQVLLGLSLTNTRAELDRLLAEERGPRMVGRLARGPLRGLLGDDPADFAISILTRLIEGEDPGWVPVSRSLQRVEHAATQAGQVVTDLGYPLVRLFGALFRPEEEVGAQVPELEEMLRTALVWSQVREAVRPVAEIPGLEDRRGLLAETLDCASHRYDAWVTSLATERLGRLRDERPTGLVIGAFGWVEDLALVRRSPVQQPPAGVPQAYAAGAGGLVHAPGLAHAATAAVLRGARLAHAPGDEADRALEMDLSSARVREARELLAGMRAGQELGPLLGYRFERWVHEADPGLNRFVASLRALAPSVVAKEVDRVATGEVELGVEAVAATQVVDGVRLLELFRASPDRILARLQDPPPALARYAGPWTGPVGDDWPTLLGLLGRLDLLLDAVADLLLAEGVHQVVAGNPARASAAMDALSGDAMPPDPDVVAQPLDRAGLSHRVTVLLPPPEYPAPAQGWSDTPRARANPVLERWCRTALGPASRIAVARSGRRLRRLSSLEVGALDLVLAAGQGRPGLDLFWARVRRTKRGLPARPLLTRPAGTADNVLTIGEAWQLAASLRALLADARAMAPADLVHDVATDPLRSVAVTQSDRDRLEALRAELDALATAPDPADPGGRIELADALASFGIGHWVDAAELDTSAEGTVAALDSHLAAAQAQARRQLESVAALLADGTTDGVAKAFADVVGDDLPVPLGLDPAEHEEPFLDAWSGKPTDLHAVRRWLVRHASVRPAVSRHAETLLLRSALGRRTRLRGVTLHAAGWLGESLPQAMSDPSALTSLVVETGPDLEPERALCGLVVDSWHETLPRRRRVDDRSTPGEAAAEPEEVATTGLAVHANGPDSRAPQSLLLAVSPDRQPWTRDKVLAVLDSTRELARMRLVTLEKVPLVGTVLPAAHVAHWSLQGEPVIDPRWLSTVAEADAPAFVKFLD